MPIEIRCPNCAAAIRAPDKYAGKRVKCPKCQGTIAIPAATAKAAAPSTKPQSSTPQSSKSQSSKQPKTAEQSRQPTQPAAAKKPAIATKSPTPAKPSPTEPTPAKPVPTKPVPAKSVPAQPVPVGPVVDQWHVQTDDGEQYGPVSKDELHEWIAEGRLDASCQVLCEGWQQWKWAEEVFGELSTADEPIAEENPFAGIGAITPPVESSNPFESPQVTSSPAVSDSGPAEGEITPLMRHALAQTRPWVLFLSILGFVGGGFAILGCLVLFVVSIVMAGEAGGSVVFSMILSIVYGAVAALYLYAAYFLFTYASQIGKFLRNHQAGELERALLAQKSFWRLVGIVTAVWLVVSLLMFLLSLVIGVAAGVSGMP